jgi:hypothetical protein
MGDGPHILFPCPDLRAAERFNDCGIAKAASHAEAHAIKNYIDSVG